MKVLSIRCDFENPTRCTGQGKRAEDISWMVYSKEDIPLCESMRAARHGSTEAYLGYAEPNENAHSKRYRAMASKTDVKVDGDSNGGLSNMGNVGMLKMEDDSGKSNGGLLSNSGMGSNMGMLNMGMPNMGNMTQPMIGYNPYCGMMGMPNMEMSNMGNMAQPMIGYNPYCGMMGMGIYVNAGMNGIGGNMMGGNMMGFGMNMGGGGNINGNAVNNNMNAMMEKNQGVGGEIECPHKRR